MPDETGNVILESSEERISVVDLIRIAESPLVPASALRLADGTLELNLNRHDIRSLDVRELIPIKDDQICKVFVLADDGI